VRGLWTFGIAGAFVAEAAAPYAEQARTTPPIQDEPEYLSTLAGSTEERRGPRREVALSTAFRIERDGGSAAMDVPPVVFPQPAGEEHLPDRSLRFVQIERMRYAQGTTSGTSIVPGYISTTSAPAVSFAVDVVDVRLYWQGVMEGLGPAAILAPFGFIVTATSSGTSLRQV
jgi:hypothetical protein